MARVGGHVDYCTSPRWLELLVKMLANFVNQASLHTVVVLREPSLNIFQLLDDIEIKINGVVVACVAFVCPHFLLAG